MSPVCPAPRDRSLELDEPTADACADPEEDVAAGSRSTICQRAILASGCTRPTSHTRLAPGQSRPENLPPTRA